jgi:hypothetical protein
MARAPRDGTQILVVVATGDPQVPLEAELVWWAEDLRRWEGDFRYDNTEGNYARAEPLAWAPLPPIPEDLIALLTRPTARRAPKRPSKAAVAAVAKAAKAKPEPKAPEPPKPSPVVVELRPKTPEDAKLAATMPKRKPA